jgi:antitoxin component of RelBE/YafQ-DinJ toxin-antitoxin module
MAKRRGITPSNVIRVLANSFSETGVLPIGEAVDVSVPSPDPEFGAPRFATKEAMEHLTTKGVGGPYSWRIDD